MQILAHPTYISWLTGGVEDYKLIIPEIIRLKSSKLKNIKVLIKDHRHGKRLQGEFLSLSFAPLETPWEKPLTTMRFQGTSCQD